MRFVIANRSVTSSDVWTAGMALGQANMALKSGYKVVIFLNVRGVYIASTKRSQDTFGATGKTLQAMLQDLMAADARVIICPMCMKQAGMKMDEVIKGLEKGGPSTFEVMTASDTTVISF